MNTPKLVDAVRRLGADDVPLPYPVPPRRDRFGAPWCPACSYALGHIPPTETCECPAGCGQKLDWSSWLPKLSEAELKNHYWCEAPNWCFRCRGSR